MSLAPILGRSKESIGSSIGALVGDSDANVTLDSSVTFGGFGMNNFSLC